MEFYHTKCGGRIDTKTKTCGGCHKHWNWFSWWMSATEIRVVPATKAKKKPKALRIKPGSASHAKWGDALPGVGQVASRLPNWPRWVRILVTAVFALGVAAVIVLVVR